MRERFIGFFPPTHEELATLLREADICFDANALLNLYRYSEPTQAALLNLLASIRDRIWIPDQVVREVLSNRPKVIADGLKRYKKVRADLDDLLARLKNPSIHPFVSEKLLETTVAHFADLEHELDDREKVFEGTFTQDPIRDRLAEVLAGRFGTNLDAEASTRIIQGGKERYRQKVPPGYKDSDKPEPECYGDLIIWNELQARAKISQKPVIFVTDDTKEDWWLEFLGNTIGPRPELVQEFYQETKLRFHMLRTARFMELGREHLGAVIASSAINEAAQVEQGGLASRRDSHGGHGDARWFGRRHAVPKPSRGQLLRAIDDFDRYFRDDPGWKPWRGHHKYAILYAGKQYPVKKIISLATGTRTDAFSGGSQANRLLKKRGFDVVRLHGDTAV